jgi:hypothetical protein
MFTGIVTAAAAATAGACGAFIGYLALTRSQSNTHHITAFGLTAAATTIGIVAAGESRALQSGTVAACIGGICFNLIGAQVLNRWQQKLPQVAGACTVAFGNAAIQAGLTLTTANVLISVAAPNTLLGSDTARFYGLCATVCGLAASNAHATFVLGLVSSQWINNQVFLTYGAALGGVAGAATGAYICGASFYVSAAAAAGVLCIFNRLCL